MPNALTSFREGAQISGSCLGGSCSSCSDIMDTSSLSRSGVCQQVVILQIFCAGWEVRTLERLSVSEFYLRRVARLSEDED
jgi:hypothetical protein